MGKIQTAKHALMAKIISWIDIIFIQSQLAKLLNCSIASNLVTYLLPIHVINKRKLHSFLLRLFILYYHYKCTQHVQHIRATILLYCTGMVYFNLCPHCFFSAYSSLSNNSIGWNNSVGWQISQNLIILQDGIIL